MLCILKVLKLLPAALLFSYPLYSLTEEAKSQARQALAAENEGRLDEAYGLWADLLSRKDEADLGEAGYSLVRSHVYSTSALKMARLGDDCASMQVWIERGKRPGPPDYSQAYDSFYPGFLIAEGICTAKEGQYEEAYDMLIEAKAELLKAPPEGASAFAPEADRYLALVKEHVISEGDYITNKGVIQTWIGKVESRSASSIEVSITYANKDLAGDLAKGMVRSFYASDCKPLGAISVDAALRGWKE